MTSGLDLDWERMVSGMDSIQPSTVPEHGEVFWACVAVIFMWMKAMDLVTRVPWCYKSHLPHLLPTQEVAKIHETLFFSVKELRLPCCAPKPNNAFFFFCS